MEVLHEGTTTVLRRARRDSDQRPVVVKLFKSETPRPIDLARLRHEYLITRDVDAAGVVKAYALEKAGDDIALVLEDFGGRPLDEILAAGRLDLESALRIGKALAAAVAIVHDQGIIHKDIKPHNILVNQETGEVKLTDFGIASRLSEEAPRGEIEDALLEGTLAYISPEQTGRMNRAVDARSDLYSLGVTLYEMLTGALPFPATTALAMVHSHIARVPAAPRERASNVPEVVSDIVMKLLAKAAEDRYQSAHGLSADLTACLEALRETGQVAPFRLGQKDTTDELRIPQRLYGRERETEALLAALARARGGSVELVLLSGYAGVGKSRLVGELLPAVGQTRGHFVAGKFDARSRNIPYTALVAALRERTRALLAEPVEVLDEDTRRLRAAVGGNGQMLIDLIPELSHLLGPQPAQPALGPVAAQNRFGLLFQNFVRVFASEEHPLVLFLDDLQWADAASLKLLTLLLSDPAAGHLLVVGAYRDHEITPLDPLSLALGELRQSGANVVEIALAPLDVAETTRFVAACVGGEAAEVEPLGRVLFDKTQGNPFFLGQLLRSLHAEGQIAWDRGAGAMRWDLARIREVESTLNVVDLMARKIGGLAPETRRILTLAACIGMEFDQKTLSVIREAEGAVVARELWQALREGLVVPLDAEYRFLAEEEPGAPAFEVAYRFLHDRVHQAAYSLLDEAERKATHLRIGRLLCRQSEGIPRDERLFKIVDHRNLGAELVTSRGERIDLARWNLAAGQRARAATAYPAAAAYFEAGKRLLDDASWGDEYALSYALHLARAEAASLNGQHDEAVALFERLLASVKAPLERAQLYSHLVTVHGSRGDFAQAMHAGQAALALVGITLPDTDDARRAALAAELAMVSVNLRGRKVEELALAPTLTDPTELARLEILVKLVAPSYLYSPTLYCVIAVMPVNILLRGGNTDMASYVFGNYAFFLNAALGRYSEMREFVALTVALLERYNNVELLSKTCLSIANCSALLEHIGGQARDYLLRGRDAGLAGGDFSHLSYICQVIALLALSLGDDLSRARRDIEDSLALLLRTRDAMSTPIVRICKQMVENLEGRTQSRASLSDDGFDEIPFVEGLKASGFAWAVCVYYTLKLQVLFYAGDHEAAFATAVLAEESAAAGAGMHLTTEIPFYTGLTLAALIPSASEADRERYTALFAAARGKTAIYAEQCPANYLHQRLLLDAEAARVEGRHEEAFERYDEAIAAAQEGGFTHHEALADELAARFFLGRGKPKIGKLYLNEAYRAYLRWGAVGRASDIFDRYPDLIRRPGPPGTAQAGELSVTTTTASDSSARLDAAAMIRAGQAIASEIEIEKLLDRLIRIVVENAGADRGVLVLHREDRLMIEATMTVSPEAVEVGSGAPLAEGADLAMSVVQFVARTREPVVLGDAQQESAFSADPYLTTRAPHSLLCVAMTHRGRLIGILYLENRAARDAFTKTRVEIAGLLAAQAAIAVENALLVAGIQRRTEALSAANDHLSRELAERAQAEAAREALKEELFRVQTPLIPINSKIMVMPLIGTIDGERAQQVLETALRGVHANRARVVILDVTGVEHVDTGVTGGLVRTAEALRLLGARAVITGIRPDAAMALLSLGVDLRDLVTRGTLESGIAYAMELLGERWGRGAEGRTG